MLFDQTKYLIHQNQRRYLNSSSFPDDLLVRKWLQSLHQYQVSVNLLLLILDVHFLIAQALALIYRSVHLQQMDYLKRNNGKYDREFLRLIQKFFDADSFSLTDC